MTAAWLVAALVGTAALLAGTGARGRMEDALPDAAAARPPGAMASGRPFGRRPVAPSSGEVAMLMDVVAAALSAGLPPARALATAGEALPGPTGEVVARVAALWLLGAPPAAGWGSAPPELEPLRRVLQIVSDAGVPGVPLLRAAADDVRRRERQAARARAEQLGVRMVLPLGLCALPAFTAWAVVPVVLSLAEQVLG